METKEAKARRRQERQKEEDAAEEEMRGHCKRAVRETRARGAHEKEGRQPEAGRHADGAIEAFVEAYAKQRGHHLEDATVRAVLLKEGRDTYEELADVRMIQIARVGCFGTLLRRASGDIDHERFAAFTAASLAMHAVCAGVGGGGKHRRERRGQGQGGSGGGRLRGGDGDGPTMQGPVHK